MNVCTKMSSSTSTTSGCARNRRSALLSASPSGQREDETLSSPTRKRARNGSKSPSLDVDPTVPGSGGYTNLLPRHAASTAAGVEPENLLYTDCVPEALKSPGILCAKTSLSISREGGKAVLRVGGIVQVLQNGSLTAAAKITVNVAALTGGEFLQQTFEEPAPPSVPTLDMIEVDFHKPIGSYLTQCKDCGSRDGETLINLLIAPADEVSLRSAFLQFERQYPPYGTVEPLPSATGALSTILVNRIVETFDLLMAWMHYYCMGAYKCTVPVLSQMSGMGKSAFSMLFQQALARPPETCKDHRRRLVNRLKTANVFARLLEAFSDAEEEAIIADTSRSVLQAAIETIIMRNPDHYPNGWKRYAEAAVISVFPVVREDGRETLRHGILSALGMPASCNLSLKNIMDIIMSVKERQLVLVVDEFASWSDDQYDQVKKLSLEWITHKQISMLFVGTATSTLLRKRQYSAGLSFFEIALTPFSVEDIQEMIIRGQDKISGSRRFADNQIVEAANDIIAKVGGHARSTSNEIYKLLVPGVQSKHSDEYIYPTAREMTAHFEQIDSLSFSPTNLASQVFPSVALAAILGHPIDVRKDVGGGWKLKEVLIGFPLPFCKLEPSAAQKDHKKESSASSELWKAQIGSHTRAQLQVLLQSNFIKIPIKALNGSPTMDALKKTLKQLVKCNAVGTPFENALVGATVMHKMLLDLVGNPELYNVNYAMPFLVAAGLDGSAPWPHMLEVNTDSLADSRTYKMVTSEDCGIVTGAGRSDYAPDKAILTPAAHLIFQNTPLAAETGGLSFWNIVEEFNKMPSSVHSLYAKNDTLICLFIFACTMLSEGVKHIFDTAEDADLMILNPGEYLCTKSGKSQLVGAEFAPVSRRECRRYLLEVDAETHTEFIKVVEGYPPASMQTLSSCRVTNAAAATHSSDIASLYIPDGIRVVVLNPSSTSTIWKQIVHFDISQIVEAGEMDLAPVRL